MGYYFVNSNTMTNIADAIREKTGSTNNITAANMANEIANISGGGGGMGISFDAPNIYINIPDISDQADTGFMIMGRYCWGLENFTVTNTNIAPFDDNNNINIYNNIIISDYVMNMYDTFYNHGNKQQDSFNGFWCGNRTTNFAYCYFNRRNKYGQPVCGSNVIDMNYAYYQCHNLSGNAACGENVSSMGCAYYECYNLNGVPACGGNVTNMSFAYQDCYNLTGNPACGREVRYMNQAYENCYNLNGVPPICGEYIDDNGATNNMYMCYTYFDCRNLTGAPYIGNHVFMLNYAYWNCTNLEGDCYIYNGEAKAGIAGSFGGNSQCTFKQRNIHIARNAIFWQQIYGIRDSNSIVGENITWTDMEDGNGFYCKEPWNLYIYNNFEF